MQARFMSTAVLVIAGALVINAQTPQKPATSDQQRATPSSTAQTVTVTGCLMAEKDVPGRRPNAAERAGVTDDYILTGVKMAQSSAASGIGLAPMYEIEGIAEAELQKHLNHQVEITGSLSRGDAMGNRGAAAAAGSAASANADLPQLQATTMKMLSATCPAVK
jgi:cytochrome oxidase assembly protein ShyY1